MSVQTVAPANTSQGWEYSLTVDGKSWGVFDHWTGGTAAVSESRHRPGGMGQEKTYRSLPSYGTGTLQRVYEIDRDHELIRTAMTAQAGRANAVVTGQPLDGDGNPYGKPMVYSGRLGTIDPGDSDSTSSEPRMLQVEVQVETIS